MRSYQKYLVITLIISLFSVALCLPQIITKGAIVGSDAIFHYNRFYDTAMQIKNHNLNYFISSYGFQQSGRIVNALYGPLFAYFQGLLVLASGSWFGYQILSRIVLGIVAGLSTYLLLHKAKIRDSISLPIALFFLTTYTIQYWTIRQGFSSWGAAFMPLCLIPALSFVQRQNVSRLQLALAVALMCQIHILSSAFLVLAYIPFFLYAFFKSQKRWGLFGKVIQAVLIYIPLSLNIWIPFLKISLENLLVQPFINKHLPSYTITQKSSDWLVKPVTLAFLIMLVFFFCILKWKTINALTKVTFTTFLLFLFLSSSFFPWSVLVENKVKFAEIIQFPMRFFLPATVLLMLLIGLIIEEGPFNSKRWTWLLSLIALSGLLQSYQDQTQNIKTHYQSDTPILMRLHTKMNANADEIRSSLHSHNLEEFLHLVVKSTPDYLPQYYYTNKNKYDLYESLVIDSNDNFQKVVKGEELIITWSSDEEADTNIPVIVYYDTEISLNGKSLADEDYYITAIGTPIVSEIKGENQLIISYPSNRWFNIILIFTIICWLILVAAYLIRFVGWEAKLFRY